MSVALVMGVWKVGVGMHHWLVSMGMCMLCAGFDLNIVRMLVMLIVRMFVAVCHGFVSMLMLMPLGQMQPKTNRHEHPGSH